jgi:hypothetical protein
MIKRASYYSLLLAGLMAAGCDTIDRTQVRIAPVQSRTGARTVTTAQDREAVRNALQPIVRQLKLQDITRQSLIPNVIVHYQQMDTTSPVKLIAWENNGAILVDLMQGEGNPGESGIYQRARDNLIDILRTQFGERATLVPYRREAEQRRKLTPEP